MQMEFVHSERWRWMGIALLQPLIVVGLYFPNLVFMSVLWDWGIRAVFLGILVFTRHLLLPSFRHRALRHGAIIMGPLFAVILSMGMWRDVANEVIIALRILDALLNGYMAAMIFESLISALCWAVGIKGVKTEDNPFKIAERMRFLRRAVEVLKRVAFVLVLLILLGIYILTRGYIFDLLLFSRLAAGVIGLGFVAALILLNERVKRRQEKELQWVEREIETALDSMLAWRPPGEEHFDPSVLLFWEGYHRLLQKSQRTPVHWEDWAFILLLQGLLLVEPFMIGLWAL